MAARSCCGDNKWAPLLSYVTGFSYTQMGGGGERSRGKICSAISRASCEPEHYQAANSPGVHSPRIFLHRDLAASALNFLDAACSTHGLFLETSGTASYLLFRKWCITSFKGAEKHHVSTSVSSCHFYLMRHTMERRNDSSITNSASCSCTTISRTSSSDTSRWHAKPAVISLNLAWKAGPHPVCAGTKYCIPHGRWFTSSFCSQKGNKLYERVNTPS